MLEQTLKNFDPLSQYKIVNNALCIGDLELGEIFELGHTTPLYIYSKDIIKAKIDTLRKLFSPDFKIYYSIKSNPFKDVISYLYQYTDGFDVSSINELNLALDTGISGNNICYTGPAKSKQELELAINSDVVISAESKLEIEKILQLGASLNKLPSIIVRVNPKFTQDRAGMKMASGSSPFGIDEELLPEMMEWIENSKLNFKGFHIYTGSQILDANAINETQSKIFKLLGRLASICEHPIEVINVGGGFGIPYFSKHNNLDIASVANNLNSLLSNIGSKKFSTCIYPILELGRYLVGESGVYLCKVIEKKVSRGKTYIITNGGMHHHLAASGNLGQKIRKNVPIYIANNIFSKKIEKVTVTGKLCTPLDILADDVEISEAKVGDYIAIMNSGAYGLSASPINFLSHPIAEEILV